MTRHLIPFNVRFGHATNSSSSHSFVIWPGAQDEFPSGEEEEAQYGWSNFVLASERQKRMYVAETLLSNRLNYSQTNEERTATAAAACALAGLPIELVPVIANGYVDHESVLATPATSDPDAKAFVDEFLAFVLQPDIAILGGNDNEPTETPSGVERVLRLPLPRDVGRPRIRRDPVYGFWTIYKQYDGNRTRFRWNDEPVPDRASIPELVDLKITDRCTGNCNYCYQGSTWNGLQANERDIYAIIRALAGMGVFEVVLGGGEPTSHPFFNDIVKHAASVGITVAVTTRNTRLLASSDYAEPRKLLSAIGVSVADKYEARDAVRAAIASGVDSKLVLHVIPELLKEDQLDDVLEVAGAMGVKVLFLGLKCVGRAAGMPEPNNPSWIAKAKEFARATGIGIDTTLAARYNQEIQQSGVPPVFYDLHEGRWSMYIDAVTHQCGPSSYQPEELVGLQIPGESDEALQHAILERFRSFL